MAKPDEPTIADQIRAMLLEDRAECVVDYDGPGPTDAAIEACVSLAYLCVGADRWAAFGEDECGVSLVLTSTDRTRRVDFRIAPDGLSTNIIRLGPGKDRSFRMVLTSDRELLLAAVRWVRGES